MNQNQVRLHFHDVCYGDTVRLSDAQIGSVRFIGEISAGDPANGRNKSGIFYGISLQTMSGSHDGIVRGRKYFSCPRKHGVFVRLSYIDEVIKTSSMIDCRYHYDQIVWIKNKKQLGAVRFIGCCPHLDHGNDQSDDLLWFGIEISAESSKNKYLSNGTIENIRYFTSSKNCTALFVQKSNLNLPDDSDITAMESIAPSLREHAATKSADTKRGKSNRKQKRRKSSLMMLFRNKKSGSNGDDDKMDKMDNGFHFEDGYDEKEGFNADTLHQTATLPQDVEVEGSASPPTPRTKARNTQNNNTVTVSPRSSRRKRKHHRTRSKSEDFGTLSRASIDRQGHSNSRSRRDSRKKRKKRRNRNG